jgi:hypothetical protein
MCRKFRATTKSQPGPSESAMDTQPGTGKLSEAQKNNQTGQTSAPGVLDVASQLSQQSIGCSHDVQHSAQSMQVHSVQRLTAAQTSTREVLAVASAAGTASDRLHVTQRTMAEEQTRDATARSERVPGSTVGPTMTATRPMQPAVPTHSASTAKEDTNARSMAVQEKFCHEQNGTETGRTSARKRVALQELPRQDPPSARVRGVAFQEPELTRDTADRSQHQQHAQSRNKGPSRSRERSEPPSTPATAVWRDITDPNLHRPRDYRPPRNPKEGDIVFVETAPLQILKKIGSGGTSKVITRSIAVHCWRHASRVWKVAMLITKISARIHILSDSVLAGLQSPGAQFAFVCTQTSLPQREQLGAAARVQGGV